MPAFCSICNKHFAGPIVPVSHLNGAAHLARVAQRPQPRRAPQVAPPQPKGEVFAFTIDAPAGNVETKRGRELINETNLRALALAAARFATSSVAEVVFECTPDGGPSASGHLFARLVADSSDESTTTDFNLATHKLSVPASSSSTSSQVQPRVEGATTEFPTKLRAGRPGLAIDWLSTASVPMTLVVRLTLQGSGRNSIVDAKKGLDLDEPTLDFPAAVGYVDGVDNLFFVYTSGACEIKSTSSGVSWKTTGEWTPFRDAPVPKEAFHIEAKKAIKLVYLT